MKNKTFYSPGTDTEYNSKAELLAAEANGFVVVLLAWHSSQKSKDGRVLPFARTYGPYAIDKEAQAKAASLRNTVRMVDLPKGTYVDRVTVEPLWKNWDTLKEQARNPR